MKRVVLAILLAIAILALWAFSEHERNIEGLDTVGVPKHVTRKP